MQLSSQNELREHVKTSLRLSKLALVKLLAAERKWTIEQALEALIEEGLQSAKLEQSI